MALSTLLLEAEDAGGKKRQESNMEIISACADLCNLKDSLNLVHVFASRLKVHKCNN